MALEIGNPAPDFNLPGVDGKTCSLADFAGKAAVVIIFSCNHCPVVMEYEDRMVALQRDYADRGVALVAINCNDAENYPADSFENMKLRAQSKGFNFPYLYDESQQSAMQYGATRTPEVFLVGPGRKLAYHGRIDDSADDPAGVERHELREALDQLLAGGSVAVPETTPVGCTIKWRLGGCRAGCPVEKKA